MSLLRVFNILPMSQFDYQTARKVITDPVLFLAFGFGSGLAPKAPGTFGTLVAIPIYFLLLDATTSVYVAAIIIFSLFGVWICDQAVKRLGVEDHQGIVWDEMAGFLITMAAVPFSWMSLCMGFVLFRFFDIVKPWPIRTVDQQIKGGLGVMLDDVLAGLFAMAIMLALSSLSVLT